MSTSVMYIMKFESLVNSLQNRWNSYKKYLNRIVFRFTVSLYSLFSLQYKYMNFSMLSCVNL